MPKFSDQVGALPVSATVIENCSGPDDSRLRTASAPNPILRTLPSSTVTSLAVPNSFPVRLFSVVPTSAALSSNTAFQRISIVFFLVIHSNQISVSVFAFFSCFHFQTPHFISNDISASFQVHFDDISASTQAQFSLISA